MEPKNFDHHWIAGVAIAVVAGLAWILASASVATLSQRTHGFSQAVGVVFDSDGPITGTVLRPKTCTDILGEPYTCEVTFGGLFTDHDLLILTTSSSLYDDGDWRSRVGLRDSTGQRVSVLADMRYALGAPSGQPIDNGQAIGLAEQVFAQNAQQQSYTNDRVYDAWPWRNRAKALFAAVLAHDVSQYTWVWIIEHQDQFKAILLADLQRACRAVTLTRGVSPHIKRVYLSIDRVPTDIQARVNADAEASSAVIRAKALLDEARRTGIPVRVLEKAAPVMKRPLVPGMHGSTT